MSDTNTALPQQFVQAQRIYDAMKTDAQPSADEGFVWKGSLVQLFDDQGIPRASYTVVTRLLKEMNAIRQIARGGGPSPSIWAVMNAPTEEGYRAAAHKVNKKANGRSVELQAIVDLNRRVAALEPLVETLQAQNRRLDQRLKNMEERTP